MIQAGYNGSQVSTMDADGLVSQHQSISSHSTDSMCLQLTKKPWNYFKLYASLHDHM